MFKRWSTSKLSVASGLMISIMLTASLEALVWGPELRLTYDGATSETSQNNAWCVTASGDFVHVVWFDGRDGSPEIYYRQSADNGSTWAEEIRITDDAASSEYPSVVCQGSNIHVVWADRRDGPTQPYYKHSADNGETWSDDARLSDTLQPCVYPSVAAWEDNVHVAWEDGRQGWSGEIYYIRSSDNGEQWYDAERLTNDGAQSGSPSVAAWEDNVHVAWQDKRDGEFEIYYKRSTDNAVTWGPDRPLTSTGQSSWYPCIAVCQGDIHVVWQDVRDGNFEIYHISSSDNGATWGEETRLTDDTADSWYPSIAASGSGLHVVWQDTRDGNAEVYYKGSADNGATWGTDTRLTEYRDDSKNPSIAVSGDNLHVAWWDERSDNGEIFYRHGNLGAGVDESQDCPVYDLEVDPAAAAIRYSLPYTMPVSMKVYDVSGRLVAKLVDGEVEPGVHTMRWTGKDDINRKCAAGVYFLRFKTEEYQAAKKMVLLK